MISFQRVLCTHVHYSRFPLDILLQKIKVIFLIRNPRDVAVSYYHFAKNINIWNYNDSWSNFFKLFIEGRGILILVIILNSDNKSTSYNICSCKVEFTEPLKGNTSMVNAPQSSFEELRWTLIILEC